MFGISARSLRAHLIGQALRNSEQGEQRFSIRWGLPVLSSDAISSVAYAVEEVLIVLVPAIGLASYGPLLGITGVIIGLLAILVVCYRQVIDAYPQGGGAYSVAKHDLGRTPSLVSASALIVDYILTIAVSACAGTAAITSAFPDILPFDVPITVVLICLLTLGNLRGLRESSKVFGLPTYLFAAAMLALIVVGLARVLFFGGVSPATTQSSMAATGEGLSLILLLRAFSSGCSALTGVEAVSNSVRNFKDPAQKNAKRALLLLALIVACIFGGVGVLTSLAGVVPNSSMTVIAQLSGRVFGNDSIMFFVIQVLTALILLLAANTAFNGLPQLLSILAADRFVPARFGRRGTRLVFSNGILFAAIVAIVLVVAYGADEHSLIPFYSVGVFMSFTIAQSGMVRHWLHARDPKLKRRAIINGFGAVVTGVVLIVVLIGKFMEGAWAVLVVIALMVLAMDAVRRHYDAVEADLFVDTTAHMRRGEGAAPSTLLSDLRKPDRISVIIPIANINKAFLKAYRYAEGLGVAIEVYHVAPSAAAGRRFRKRYERLEIPSHLVIDITPYRNVNEVLLAHIEGIADRLGSREMLTVVIPRIVTTRWWQYALHNQSELFIENALFEHRRIAVVAVPYVVAGKPIGARSAMAFDDVEPIDFEDALAEREDTEDEDLSFDTRNGEMVLESVRHLGDE